MHSPPTVYPDYYLLPIPILLILIYLGIYMKQWRILLVTGAVILILVFSYNSILDWFTDLPYPDNKGIFGDQFGALSCLFSGLAFAGLIATLKQQHDEMQEMQKQAKISQLTDEIYRRIDYVKKLEASCCLITEEKVQSNFAITHSVSHKGLEAIDIIVTNIEKIINWDDKQIETFATNNTFTNGSINAWIKSCIHLSNFIYHESKLVEEEKHYYLEFFISSIPAPAANLMYLWHNLIQIPGSNETIEYLMKHRLINPPLVYGEQTFQRKFQRCIEINSQ